MTTRKAKRERGSRCKKRHSRRLKHKRVSFAHQETSVIASAIKHLETDADSASGKGVSVFLFQPEGKEPPHIHVEQGERYAKLWLAPVSIARAKGFRSNEMREILQIVQNNRQEFEERWHEYVGDKV